MKKIFVLIILSILALGALLYWGLPKIPHATLTQLINTGKALLGILSVLSFVQVILALYSLDEKRARDSNEYALSALNFFRTQVIPHQDKIIHDAQAKNIRLLDLGSLKKRTGFNLDEMPGLPKKKFDDYHGTIFQNEEMRSEIIQFLNALEELSAKIVLPKNFDHPAYESIGPLFVAMVERNAIMLYILRNFINSKYPHVVRLYLHWKKKWPDAFMSNEELNKYNLQRISEMHKVREKVGILKKIFARLRKI